MPSRHRLLALAVAASAALSVVPSMAAAAAPTSVNPNPGRALTVFTLKTPSAPIKPVLANGGFVVAELKAPAGSDSECRSHHVPTPKVHGKKATFRLDPNDLYSQRWCKGKWRVTIAADDDGDGSSDRVLARTTFKVR